jgi:predicted RNA-binding protein YlxR (DUF448 family)
VVRQPEGGFVVDALPKAPGRGAYICRSAQCLEQAAQGRSISRSLDRPLTAEDADRLRELAQQLSREESDVGS